MLVLVAYFLSGLPMPEEGTQPFPVTNYGKLPVYFVGFFSKKPWLFYLHVQQDMFQFFLNSVYFQINNELKSDYVFIVKGCVSLGYVLQTSNATRCHLK